MLLILALLLAGPAQAQPLLESIRASKVDAGVALTLQLSAPAVPGRGTLLENPRRVYFDLPGVVPRAGGLTNVGFGGVGRVRVALNQLSPPVTRVVVDLDEKMTWHIEAGATPNEFRVIFERQGQEQGRVMIPPAPPAVDRRQQIAGALFAMAPWLEQIQAGTGPSDADLTTMLGTAEGLSTGARAMRASKTPSDLAVMAAADA
ncbi:MAG: AMIN domain-containing protein, partial [Acidobacteriota bacterium]|nr:AMIN domain-containing protein [Acidobacteriota bacterium]